MTSPTVGRPRITPGRPEVDARTEILDAAAALFSERGFAGTSTRQIAERAGMRQASMYYHFAGKEEILLALLDASVTPTLDRAAEYLDADDPVVALYELARSDVDMLLAEPHNIGTMYLSPELRSEVFAPFRAARAELMGVYAALAARITPGADPELAGACCMQLVEVVIPLRRDDAVPNGLAESIALTCLRVAGASEEGISRVLGR
ncbi:TetR/AcrR family transcriptional regulator [Salinibacterium sp. SYSU T00001]|uniref:TetR/AcrR family transcriptional regulator n=1 Tax=Homoserinimonas sedimenticola TaxID=2986805 RepID=UPI002235A804|nr:TetR/AcrR family transcriptional regulator [Salinibacterium sedimenticola]MCW4385377.1 TetR/AcrR family transcriptional regulator [Salinibacterium sedimenticola]